MKLCVTSTGNGPKALMDMRFGRCRYFAIYDTEIDKFEFIENMGANASQGAGVTSAQKIIDLKVDGVITGNMGPNSMSLLEASGIKVYRAYDVTVEDAIKLFGENKLEIVDKPVSPHFGMGQGNRRGWR